MRLENHRCSDAWLLIARFTATSQLANPYLKGSLLEEEASEQ